MSTLSDITSNRHGGNAESRLAHKDGDKIKDRRRVYELICESGTHGMTLDEIAERMGRTPNSLSGRITELKRDGLVAPNGDRRKTRTGSTAAVIVSIATKNPWEINPT